MQAPSLPEESANKKKLFKLEPLMCRHTCDTKVYQDSAELTWLLLASDTLSSTKYIPDFPTDTQNIAMVHSIFSWCFVFVVFLFF